ncbi:MAG TPA: hypothetical protein VFF30_12480 [Nitrososphaerales archaeon]|nr:hypothetical protein [Nitrososphaerales archaeon]
MFCPACEWEIRHQHEIFCSNCGSQIRFIDNDTADSGTHHHQNEISPQLEGPRRKTESRAVTAESESSARIESAPPLVNASPAISSSGGGANKTVAIQNPIRGMDEEQKIAETRSRNEPNCIYCGQPVNESLCHVTPSGYAIRNLHEVCHQAIMFRANEVLESKNGKKLSLADIDRLDGPKSEVPLTLAAYKTEGGSVRSGKDQYYLDWRVLQPGETFHWVREIKRGTFFRKVVEQEVITDKRCFRVDVSAKRISSEVPIAGVDIFITVSGNAGSSSGSAGDLHFVKDGKEMLVFPNVAYPTELKKMIETLKLNAGRKS